MLLAELKFAVVNVPSRIDMNSCTVIFVLFEVPRIFLYQRVVFRLANLIPLFNGQLALALLLVIGKHSFIVVRVWAQGLQSIT